MSQRYSLLAPNNKKPQTSLLYLCVCVCVCMYICIYIYVYMCVYIYITIYIYIYMVKPLNDHSVVMVKGLVNSVKLWPMLCRTTQDGWLIVKRSDKTWSTGGGNGNLFQYSCCENLMNSMASTSASLTMLEALTLWITANCGKFLNRWEDHLTCLLRNLYAGQEATVRIGHGTTD